MSILFKLFQKQWNKTEKKDAQRIASQEPVQGIEEVTDIAYIDDGLRGHLLDVYFPRKAQDKKLPVVIDIHGGGWMYGYKELNKNYNLYLSSSGYTVFSLSYRLAPEVFMPDQIKDIFAALKWIDEHMDEFPCDRNNVYLTGDSAGGQLAGYTAVIYNNPVLEKAFCVSGAGFKFNAVALICPFFDMANRGITGIYSRPMLGPGFRKKEFAKYLTLKALLKTGGMPPCFIVSSTGDILTKRSSKKAAKLFAKYGVTYKFMYWSKFQGKKLEHVFPVTYPYMEESARTTQRMFDFFDKYSRGEEDIIKAK
ncbi:MAG: alpha/beta hydrolase [Acutalibacteraceae bacterium]